MWSFVMVIIVSVVDDITVVTWSVNLVLTKEIVHPVVAASTSVFKYKSVIFL